MLDTICDLVEYSELHLTDLISPMSLRFDAPTLVVNERTSEWFSDGR
jgi:hypothetical protein